MDYPYELEQKQKLLKNIFAEQGIMIDPPLPLTDDQDFFYRNKMEYALYWDNSEKLIKLAFHQRNSHRKIPFVKSSIERPEILKTALEVIAGLNSEKKEARAYQSLLVRCDQRGKTSAALFENHRPHPKMENLTDTLLGHTYEYSPNGFFQINLPVYEMALKEIKTHITTEKVLDLYSGVGTIGLSVAMGKTLTLVESNPAAFAELEKNCAGFEAGAAKKEVLKSTAITPILTKSELALDFITKDSTIILDPPRAGLNPKLLEKLLETAPPTIIYLSCNPLTQARDLKPLLKTYEIIKIQPYNFFPRTPHIENLAILTIK